MYKIFDRVGNQQDTTWLTNRFGQVVVNTAFVPEGDLVFRITELREKEGPAALIARVLDENDDPVLKAPVIRFWPGAPELPEWDPPPERWRSRGVVGRTNAEGDTGFGMGPGDYYDPAQQAGASAIWVGAPSTHSDLVSGLGMLPNTNHIHLDVTFQLTAGTEPGPGPTPTPTAFWTAIAAGLDQIADAIRSLDQET